MKPWFLFKLKNPWISSRTGVKTNKFNNILPKANLQVLLVKCLGYVLLQSKALWSFAPKKLQRPIKIFVVIRSFFKISTSPSTLSGETITRKTRKSLSPSSDNIPGPKQLAQLVAQKKWEKGKNRTRAATL